MTEVNHGSLFHDNTHTHTLTQTLIINPKKSSPHHETQSLRPVIQQQLPMCSLSAFSHHVCGSFLHRGSELDYFSAAVIFFFFTHTGDPVSGCHHRSPISVINLPWHSHGTFCTAFHLEAAQERCVGNNTSLMASENPPHGELRYLLI